MDMGQHWYVIKTRAKGERKAMRELHKAGIEAYLPEYQIERFNRRLRVTKVTTLCHFPRYLFALLSPGQFAAVRNCDGVNDVLPGFPMDPQAVRTRDVEAVRAAQQQHLFDDTDQGRRARGETIKNTLHAMRRRLTGRKVRVKDGPFKSFPATVEIVHSLERLRVSIQIFGQDTPVELEHAQIEELAA